MNASHQDKAASRRPLKIAVIAAALGVAACFGAAFTFIGEQPAQASDPAMAESQR